MSLANNKHLKEVEKILDNYDIVKGYLTTNDIQGVDLISEIDITKLNLDTEDKDEIAELLETHYEDSEYYFQHDKDGCYEFAIAISSGEEIFVTYEGDLCFPDDTESVKLSSDNREVEIIVYSLEWMHENGCFPSIYQLDYYSNSPELYNFYETNEYKSLGLSDDDEKQKKEVERLVVLADIIRSLEDQSQKVDDLPEEFYEAVPKLLKDHCSYFDIINATIVDAHTLEIYIELEPDDIEDRLDDFNKLVKKGTLNKGDDDYCFTIALSILPNSVRFIKGLDGILGLEVA